MTQKSDQLNNLDNADIASTKRVSREAMLYGVSVMADIIGQWHALRFFCGRHQRTVPCSNLSNISRTTSIASTTAGESPIWTIAHKAVDVNFIGNSTVVLYLATKK